MGLLRFIQAHNRNKELKKMREVQEQELKKSKENIKFCPHCGKSLE